MYHNGFKGFLYALMEHMQRLSRIKMCLRAGMIHPVFFVGDRLLYRGKTNTNSNSYTD